MNINIEISGRLPLHLGTVEALFSTPGLTTDHSLYYYKPVQNSPSICFYSDDPQVLRCSGCLTPGRQFYKSDLDILLKNKKISNYNLIGGNIIKTLPSYLENNPEKKFSLVHIDVDVYEPTICILENIWDKIVKGGVIILDDYGRVEGETIAVDEFFENKNVMIQKLPYKYKPSYIIKN